MWTNQKISRVGLLIALSFIFSYIEYLLPIPFLVPGIKLGLANVLIVIPLYLWGFKMAFLISVIRIILVTITFGNMTYMLFSMAGAFLSLIVMYGLKHWQALSMVGISTMGGVFHNLGQLLVAMAMVNRFGLLYYFPPLLIGGSVTGYIIGIVSLKTLNRLAHQNINLQGRMDKESIWINKEP